MGTQQACAHARPTEFVVYAISIDVEVIVEMRRLFEACIENIRAAHVDIKIFGLGRPVTAEYGFNAAANGPAGRGRGF